MIIVTDDEIKTNVAENLSRLLQQRNLNGLALARLCGESQPTISNLLRGQYVPKVGTLSRVASALGTTIDYLLTDPQANAKPPRKREFAESA